MLEEIPKRHPVKINDKIPKEIPEGTPGRNPDGTPGIILEELVKKSQMESLKKLQLRSRQISLKENCKESMKNLGTRKTFLRISLQHHESRKKIQRKLRHKSRENAEKIAEKLREKSMKESRKEFPKKPRKISLMEKQHIYF